jgi:hypothetical protein
MKIKLQGKTEKHLQKLKKFNFLSKDFWIK